MILTQSDTDPNMLILSNLSLDELEEAKTYRRRYGDRDSFALGNVVSRPNGELFIQGDLSTYLRYISPDPVIPDLLAPGGIGPAERAEWLQVTDSEYRAAKSRPTMPEGVSAPWRKYTGHITGTSKGQPGYRDDSVPHTLVPSRTVYRPLWVERTYEVPGGQVTLRKLRRSSEGRGW